MPKIGFEPMSSFVPSDDHANCDKSAAFCSQVFLSQYLWPPLLIYIRSFQTNNTVFTTNQCEKMSIQYTAPGFKPPTSQT